MSKKPAALKVHQIAKELGVNSKDIVARCKAEEIPDIENHLSAVSAGLALTIREWFGNVAAEAAASTATAVAEPPAEASSETKAPAKRAVPKKKSTAASADDSTTASSADTESGDSAGAKPAVAKRATKKAVAAPVEEPTPVAEP
ncbi:MAG: hypothetical protein ACO3QC_11105, partial [Phycisphaerales bacterium]